ncbi:MAG TPA: amino acid adenylation domain-containing protein, partial [Phycisphaerae bacterium]|nr:amino acid adenylation domain-containing protein [Phycisphaerae bacterium]HSA27965.1 amino acid adenylation domain-containing protein [Phycisphaerae bacterium]
ETTEGLTGTVEYNTDLFDAGTMARLVDHYLTLLEGMAESPERTVGSLPLMTSLERRQLLVEWNDTATEYPTICIHELFEERSAGAPDAVAVVYKDQSMTYAELNRRANQLAHYLRGLGVGHETLVGICAGRSPDMVVGLLGILKAGGVYMPLDPAYPRERLAVMIEDSHASVVVTTSAFRAQLDALAGRLVCLDETWPMIAGESAENPVCRVSPDNLAYVMYTSGSTGRPKGVEISHRGVVRLVKNVHYCRLGPEETILQLAPISFDASTLEIWGSLLNGGRLVLYPGEKASLDDIGAMIREHRVTTLWLTAGLFHLMVDERLNDLGGLRQLLAGGDVLSPRHVQRCMESHPHLSLINGYGPTENTTFTCCHRITDPNLIGEHVPIGRPIANTRVYILDRHMNPVPMGVNGELYAAGDGLARGYLNRPELTAERFIPDPFGDPGSRLYRTGDLARYLPDGAIHFLGRTDHQVKIRGFRVELGEIESRLEEQDDIADAVVVVRAAACTDKQLVAYLVPKDGCSLDIAQVRRFLHDRLPEHMIPERFAILPSLPLTPNGKVDRAALPDLQFTVAAGPRRLLQPRNEVECKLVGLWEELLSVQPIGVTDDFFQLGGHSLKLAQLVARVEDQFKVRLPLPVAFRASTVEKLAGVITTQTVGVLPLLVTLQASGRRQPLFILPGIGGHPYGFSKFAKLIGEDRPIYGMMAVGLDGSEPPPEQVEVIAARYCREVMAVQPAGPWLVLGYSFGGLVAFEMARQMQERGKSFAFLGMLDAAAPGYPRPVPLATKIGLHWRLFASLSLRGKLGYLVERVKSRTRRVLPRLGFYPSELPSELAHFKKATLGRCNRAMMKAYYAYRPRRIDSDLVVFRAAIPPAWAATLFDDPKMGWEAWTNGKVEDHEVPGDHLGVLKEGSNLPVLAAAISKCLSHLP